MKKGFLFIVFLSVLLAACNKTPVEVPKHPYTEEELVKAHLDESFSAFVTALDLDSTAVKNPARFVLVNSDVHANLLFRPAIIYQLKRHRKVVMELWFYPLERKVEASLEGGISIKGPVLPSDLHVYDQGKDVAKLELDRDLACLVFRFPDGTAYALNSLIISEALIDFLIEHVLSTE